MWFIMKFHYKWTMYSSIIMLNFGIKMDEIFIFINMCLFFTGARPVFSKKLMLRWIIYQVQLWIDAAMAFDCGAWFAKYLLCLFNFVFFVSIEQHLFFLTWIPVLCFINLRSVLYLYVCKYTCFNSIIIFCFEKIKSINYRMQYLFRFGLYVCNKYVLYSYICHILYMWFMIDNIHLSSTLLLPF